MNNRLDDMVLAFILLALAIVTGADHFLVKSDLTQFITGLLTGLLIVASAVYIIRVASRPKQSR